ncbi:glucosaminidase domain-containing protein [Candidatus Curtissbacteria bacterium]|nr:glucosaminidase domain-containing protein [Candidatus Curtissbacteria bacterium]
MPKKLVLVFLWFFLAPISLAVVSLLFHQNNKPIPKEKFLPLIVSETVNINHLEGQVLGVEIKDNRPIIIERFLTNTPLEPYSSFLVDVSDKYNIDYRLIPAIAMKETGGGRAAPEDSFNAWGFENGRTVFSSWEGAIDAVGKTLKTRYIDRGMTTPDEIMPIYAPPQLLTGGKWAEDINSYFSQMNSLE